MKLRQPKIPRKLKKERAKAIFYVGLTRSKKGRRLARRHKRLADCMAAWVTRQMQNKGFARRLLELGRFHVVEYGQGAECRTTDSEATQAPTPDGKGAEGNAPR
jgi:hypothetical protein